MKTTVLILILAALFVITTATPAGIVLFFNHRSTCPSGWTKVGQGQMIVSVTASQAVGVAVGTPLGNLEDRAHTHSLNGGVTLVEDQISAVSGSNNQGACHATYPATGPMYNATSNLPLAQLLLCQLSKADNNPIPFGSVAYFGPSITTCPTGWNPFTDGVGRYIVPGWDNTGMYISAGAPLASGEVRAHAHNWSALTHLQDVSYVGLRDCCLDTIASDEQMYKVNGSTQVDNNGTGSSNLPYLQLLTCVCTDSTFDFKQPEGAMIFNELGCPPGLNVSLEYAGRFLVGLPNDPNATTGIFGSDIPLKPGATETRTHDHDFNATFSTRPCGVALLSGCCGFGYVADNTYSVSGKGDSATVDFPYIEVPLCGIPIPIPPPKEEIE